MIEIIVSVIRIYEILLLIRIVVSWVMPNPSGELLRGLYQITDPYLNLFRRSMPFLTAGGMDFSPIVGFMVLQMVSSALLQGL